MAYNLFPSITPSDTVDLAQWTQNRRLTDAIYVGGAGNLVAVDMNGVTQTFTAVAGEILPVSVRRVNAANTTATALVALYVI